MGEKVRTRQCSNPRPSNSGEICPGKAFERKTCENSDCDKPGGIYFLNVKIVKNFVILFYKKRL